MRLLVLVLIFIEFLNAWKMEADKITVKNTSGGVVTHIDFRQKYDTVPLVFTLTDDTGNDPAALRIVNVTTTGFDIYTIEPQGENGPHKEMDSIPYIAIEPGEHTLPDGTKIIAKTVSIKNYQGRNVSNTSWHSVSISGFNTTPVVLAEIQTRNNERTDESVPDAVSKPWMTVAIDNISSSSFDIALERSKTTEGEITQDESVAYLVIDSNLNSGNHYFAANNTDKIEYETIRSDEIIKGWDDAGDGDYEIDFSKSYDDPIVVATKNTRNGGDGGWLRRGDVSSDKITLKVDEDRSDGTNRSHTKERAGILLFSEPFDTEFIDSSADIIINEVMYHETQTGTDNDEFVELYVKSEGNLKGYVLSDQDGHYYRFSDCIVEDGDYVIFHTGNGTDSCDGHIKHFYQGVKQYWNNTSDDVLLLKPSSSDVTTTTNSSPKSFNAKPQDYITYGTGSAVDSVPTSMNGVTLSWDDSYVKELDNGDAGVSISLTPNATDSDTSACWEFTQSNNAMDNGCSNYEPTRSTESDPNLKYSMGTNNNGKADMHITKSSIVISDPVNNTTNPKRIPGAIIRYCFTVDNTGDGSATNVKIKDTLSDNGRDNLIYSKSGKKDGDINSDCDCASIDDTSGSYDSDTKEVEIDLDTMAADTRKCAYIEAEIK